MVHFLRCRILFGKEQMSKSSLARRVLGRATRCDGFLQKKSPDDDEQERKKSFPDDNNALFWKTHHCALCLVVLPFEILKSTYATVL